MGSGFRIEARANASAEIYIYEDIGDSWFGGVTAKQFADELKALGDVQAIDLRINSAGGDVFDGLAIYRQLVDHKAKVTTHVDGIAASIASVIAMAGTEIRISEAGFFMIHDAWGVSIGNAADMRKYADLLETISGSIVDVYSARTSLKSDELVTLMGAETWLGAGEAVEKGFADVLVPNMRVAAHFDMEKHKFRNAPAELVGRPSYDAAKQRLSAMRAKIEVARFRENRGSQAG